MPIPNFGRPNEHQNVLRELNLDKAFQVHEQHEYGFAKNIRIVNKEGQNFLVTNIRGTERKDFLEDKDSLILGSIQYKDYLFVLYSDFEISSVGVTSELKTQTPVSYTHLTLPTNREV